MANNTFLAVGTLWNVGANWSLGTVPTNADQVLFDATSNSCTLDVNAVADSIDMTGYTNTLSQSTFTLKVDIDFTCSAGTFTGGSGTLTIAGSLIISGGIFTAPSGRLDFTYFADRTIWTYTSGTFNHNNGEVYLHPGRFDDHTTDFNSNTLNFYDVTFEGHTTSSEGQWILPSGSVAIVENTLDLISGRIGGGGLIQAENQVLLATGFDNASTSFTLEIVGATTRTIDWSATSSTELSNLKINSANTTLLLNDAGTLSTAKITVQAGTVTGSTGNLTMRDGTNGFEQSGGTFTAPSSTMTVLGYGDFIKSAGTFLHNNGTLRLAADRNDTITVSITSTLDLYKLITDEYNGQSTYGKVDLDGSVINVANDYTQQGHDSTNNGTINVSGNFIITDSTVQGGSATVNMTGTATQTISVNGGYFDGVLSIDKTSGTVSLITNFITTGAGADFVMNSGTFDLNGFNFKFSDQLIQTGGLIEDSIGGGTFTIGRHVATAGTITINSILATTTTGGTVFSDSAGYNLNVTTYTFTGDNSFDIQQLNTSFDNVIIDKGSTRDFSGTIDINGDLTVDNIRSWLTGSVVTLAGNLSGAANGTNTGLGLFTFDGTGTQNIDYGGIFPDVVINNIGGSVVFLSSQIFLGGYVVTNGVVNWTTNTAIATFKGTSTTYNIDPKGNAFYDLAFDKTGTSKYTLLSDVSVANDFFISDGASGFTLDGFILSVLGDILVLEQTLAGTTQIKMTGIKDAGFVQQYTDWFDTDLIIEKTAGQVTLGADLTLALDFLLNDGTFCTNEFDVTAANITILNDATFNKTPTSILTGTVTGTVNDVDDCEKKTNLFYAV